MTITSPPPVAPAPLATLRQHTLPALAAFALAAALVLFLAPYFPRTYLATAHFDRDEQPFQDANQPFADLSAGRPRLAQDLAAGLAATPLPPQALHASVDSPNPLLQHVTAEVRADDPVRAYVALKTALDAYAAAQRRHAREQLATARQTLQTKSTASPATSNPSSNNSNPSRSPTPASCPTTRPAW